MSGLSSNYSASSLFAHEKEQAMVTAFVILIHHDCFPWGASCPFMELCVAIAGFSTVHSTFVSCFLCLSHVVLTRKLCILSFMHDMCIK